MGVNVLDGYCPVGDVRGIIVLRSVKAVMVTSPAVCMWLDPLTLHVDFQLVDGRPGIRCRHQHHEHITSCRLARKTNCRIFRQRVVDDATAVVLVTCQSRRWLVCWRSARHTNVIVRQIWDDTCSKLY